MTLSNFSGELANKIIFCLDLYVPGWDSARLGSLSKVLSIKIRKEGGGAGGKESNQTTFFSCAQGGISLCLSPISFVIDPFK